MQLSEEQIKALWKQECRPERDNEQLAIAFANAVADSIRAQADARPFGWWYSDKTGEHFSKRGPDSYAPGDLSEYEVKVTPLYTHPEASAPGLSEADRNVIESAIREVELSCQYALAEDLRAILTRASAATVAEPTTPMEVLRVTYAPDMTAEEFAHMWPKFKAWQKDNQAAQQQAEPVGDALEFRVRDAIQGIANCIADPMWTGHAEVSKANLKRWHKALHDLLAAQSGQRAGAAKGWKLVPVEPTDEMVRAGNDLPRYATPARHVWEAMLAAAPTQQQEGQ